MRNIGATNVASQTDPYATFDDINGIDDVGVSMETMIPERVIKET
jgi:hypothetical protein